MGNQESNKCTFPKKGKPVRKVGQFHALLLDIEQVAVGVQVIQPVGIDEGG